MVVFGGDRPTIDLIGKGTIEVLLPRGSRDLIRARVIYQGPVTAPIEEGRLIGTLQISLDGEVLHETPVYAATDVGIGNLRQRAMDGLQELILGWW